MRQFETDPAPSRDTDPAVERLVRGDLHAGEALGVAVNVRDTLIRLAAANGGLALELCAA